MRLNKKKQCFWIFEFKLTLTFLFCRVPALNHMKLIDIINAGLTKIDVMYYPELSYPPEVEGLYQVKKAAVRPE